MRTLTSFLLILGSLLILCCRGSDDSSSSTDVVSEPEIIETSDEGQVPDSGEEIDSGVVLIQPELSFDSPDDLADFCQNAEIKTKWYEVIIPPNEGTCPWGEGDNEEMEQGAISARIEQVIPFQIPEGAIVCDMTFDFSYGENLQSKTIRYDDFFILAFNGAVVISSYDAWMDDFSEAYGLRMYSWADIKGQDIEWDNIGNYCLGEEEGLSECTVPESDEEGTFYIDIDQSLVTKLSFLGFYAQAHAFNFITTGDNDPDTDCNHTELDFRVLLKYALK